MAIHARGQVVWTRAVVCGLLVLGAMAPVAIGSGETGATDGRNGAQLDAATLESSGDDLLERWAAEVESTRGLSRRERRTQLDEFLSGVTLDDLRHVCGQVDPESSASDRPLRTLVRTWFEQRGRSPQLAELIGDLGVAEDCRNPAVQAAQRQRDELDDATRNAIGDALLAVSDANEPGSKRGVHYLHLAAQFGNSDAIFSRIETALLAPSDSVRLTGVRLAGESRDPRAGQALLELVARAEEDPPAYAESYPDAVLFASRKIGAPILPTMERLLFDHGDGALRLHAIPAVGEVFDPQSLHLLLRLYPDMHVVRDSTSALPPGPERDRYAALHTATRRLEPQIFESLTRGTPEDARVAFALVDRSVRFGPVVRTRAMSDALLDFGLRRLEPDEARIRDVIARVQDPPRSAPAP